MKFPSVKTIPNKELFRLVLIPEERRMPEQTKKFLKRCEKEFHKRKIKLVPIMKDIKQTQGDTNEQAKSI